MGSSSPPAFAEYGPSVLDRCFVGPSTGLKPVLRGRGQLHADVVIAFFLVVVSVFFVASQYHKELSYRIVYFGISYFECLAILKNILSTCYKMLIWLFLDFVFVHNICPLRINIYFS